MAHGTPDWGLVGPKTTVHGLDDLGEHAVRLGSPHLFDRAGDILALTDFRVGLGAWEGFHDVGGGAVHLATEHSRQGAYSMKLTAGMGVDDNAGLRIRIPYPVIGCFGHEFTYSMQDYTVYFGCSIEVDDTVDLWIAELQFHALLGRLVCITTGGAQHEIAAGLGFRISTQPEHTMKIVADLSTRMYVRAIYNGLAYNISRVPMNQAATAGAWSLEAVIEHMGDGGHNPEGYVDNVIVTQNEP